GEHEPEMGQAAGHHEQMEELVGGKHPGPEDGPVQEVEHRPHAIEHSTKKGESQINGLRRLFELGTTDQDPPTHCQIDARRHDARYVTEEQAQGAAAAGQHPRGYYSAPLPRALQSHDGEGSNAAGDEEINANAVGLSKPAD